MSAETLRRAASLMRERAKAATPGPWEAFRRGDPSGPFGVCSEMAGDLDGDIFEDAATLKPDAEHIASWHPAVALAVADLLDALAHDREVDPYLPKHFDEPALAVARAYLGESA